MKKNIKKKDYWFIGKIQVSIECSDGVPGSTLIYNQDKEWQYMCEREFGEGVLGDDLKGYFKICHKKGGELYIHSRVNDKTW